MVFLRVLISASLFFARDGASNPLISLARKLIVYRQNFPAIFGHVNTTKGTTKMTFTKNGFFFQFTGVGRNGASWRVTYNGKFFANVSTSAVIRALNA